MVSFWYICIFISLFQCFSISFSYNLLACSKERFIIFLCFRFGTHGCFINHNIYEFNNLLNPFIVKFISFSSRRLSKEDSFINSRFKISKLVIIFLYETFSSKNSKVFDNCRLTESEFIWSFIIVYSNMIFFNCVHSCICFFFPEGVRHSWLIKDGRCHLLNCHVHSFFNSILLRSFSYGKLSFDAMLFTKFEEHIWYKLSSYIISRTVKSLDLTHFLSKPWIF